MMPFTPNQPVNMPQPTHHFSPNNHHTRTQVMSAIAYLHSQGVVHRDLKAENLLVVDPTADFPTVKLIDFGFATILRHNLTGSFLGTGGYLAPEIRQQRLYSESVRCAFAPCASAFVGWGTDLP